MRRCTMTTRPTGFTYRAEVPALTRFILVNERIPRENACCASCSARIERGYVRNPHTRLVFCDAVCFAAHEKRALPIADQHTRRVS
jgi:hypothetical protein